MYNNTMKITYRNATRGDFASVMQIAEKELNSGDGYMAYMRGIFDGLGRDTAGILAFCGESLAGFAFAERGMALTGGRTDFFDRIRADIGDEPIWTGAATAVLPGYMNMKIGSALYIYLLSLLEDIGAKHLLLEIWVRPDGYAPSNANLATAGHYTEYGTVANFYREAGEQGYICPVCGAHCVCSAKIAVVHI